MQEFDATKKLDPKNIAGILKGEGAPKCVIKWENGKIVADCASPQDQAKLVQALNDNDISIRVKPKME